MSLLKKYSKEEILQLAEDSDSLTDLSKKIGYTSVNSNNINRVKELLLNYGYDLSKFKSLNKSVLNNEEKLKEIVSESFNYKEVINKFGLSQHGSTNKILQKYLRIYNISTEHFGRRPTQNLVVLNKEDIFCINSNKETRYIKEIIIREKLLPYVCSCGVGSIWNNKPLTLQLEHKNGNNKDHRLENLEFLCLNCHSQTETYGSKNAKNRKTFIENKVLYVPKNQIEQKFIIQNKIDDLLNKIHSMSSYKEVLEHFEINANNINIEKFKYFLDEFKEDKNVKKFIKNLSIKKKTVNFPESLDVLELVKQYGFVQASKKIGCSDNGLRKYLKRNNLL